MASVKPVAALFVAVTIAATLFVPFSAVVNENSGVQSVANESVTAQTDTFVDLDGYRLDDTSETVYWYNSTSDSFEQVSEGTDYEMNYEGGQVKALSNGTIGDGDELKVSYDYAATDGSTTTIVTLTPLFLALLIMGVLAAKATEMM